MSLPTYSNPGCNWKRYLIILFLIIAVLVLFIVWYYRIVLSDILSRPYRRIDYYQQALARSKQTGKPLLVVGDPEAGNVLTRVLNKLVGNYGYGDTCIDLYSNDPRVKKVGLAEYLSSCQDNSHVVFISCVLEFVDNLDDVSKELDRVSGSDLFVVFVKYEGISKYYDGKHQKILNYKNQILGAPPENPKLEWIKLNSI